MATYIEIRNLFNDSELSNRADVAVMIAASNLLAETTPTTEQQAWAAGVFSNPKGEGQKALMAVLSANASATVDAIKNASDSALQANVDAVVPALVAAYKG